MILMWYTNKKPGKEQVIADYLSRFSYNVAKPRVIGALQNDDTVAFRESVTRFQRSNVDCRRILQLLRDDVDSTEEMLFGRYKLKDIVEKEDLLYLEDDKYGLRLVIGNEIGKKLFDQLHFGVLTAHQGMDRTLYSLQSCYFWRRMAEDVKNWINDCAVCEQYKKVWRQANRGPLLSLNAVERFHTIAIDHVGPFRRTKRGNTAILTVMDMFINLVAFIPVKDTTAKVAAQAIIDNWISIYGVPNKLISDQGPAFRSTLFREICRNLRISNHFSGAYHHEGNGKIERVYRFLNGQIRTLVEEILL